MEAPPKTRPHEGPSARCFLVENVMATKRSIVWIDAGGRTRQTIPAGNATLSSIMAQIQAVSNADVLTWFEGSDNSLSPSPVSATYPDVADAAILVYADGGGLEARLTVPAPLLSIFLADGSTVDPATIVALNAAVIGTLVTASGSAVTTYLSGVRQGKTFNA